MGNFDDFHKNDVILKIDGGLFGWSRKNGFSPMKFDQQTKANMDSRLQSLISPQQYQSGLNTCEAKFEKMKLFTTSWAVVGVFMFMFIGAGINMVMSGDYSINGISGSTDSPKSIISLVAGSVLLFGYVVAICSLRNKAKGEVETVLMGQWSGLANAGARIETNYGKKHGPGNYIAITNLGPQVELSG
jgi:hypothetical protein